MGCWFNDLLPDPPPQVSVAADGSKRSVLVRDTTDYRLGFHFCPSYRVRVLYVCAGRTEVAEAGRTCSLVRATMTPKVVWQPERLSRSSGVLRSDRGALCSERGSVFL